MKQYKNHACIGFGCKICIENREIEESNKREWLNDRLKELAPCLIDGHEAEETAVFGRTIRVENDRWAQGHKTIDGELIPIDLKLCARCGVVYEEKSK